MRNCEKRLKKLYDGLAPQHRVVLALDAMVQDDETTTTALFESAPRRHYSATAADLSDTVDAVYDMSFRFDRTFFKLQFELHKWLAVKLAAIRAAGDVDEASRNEFLQDIEKIESNMDARTDQIYVLVLGVKELANRSGLSFERLLAFSIVPESNPDELNQCREAPDAVKEKLSEEISAFADTLLERWKSWRHSITDFAA